MIYKMFVAIRNRRTSPDEFRAGFHSSRHLALAEGIDAELYLAALGQASADGVPNSGMYDHLKRVCMGSPAQSV